MVTSRGGTAAVRGSGGLHHRPTLPAPYCGRAPRTMKRITAWPAAPARRVVTGREPGR